MYIGQRLTRYYEVNYIMHLKFFIFSYHNVQVLVVMFFFKLLDDIILFQLEPVFFQGLIASKTMYLHTHFH